MPRIIAGFIAAALAVLLVHQPIVFALIKAGLLPAQAVAYDMRASPTALPQVASFFKSVGFAGWPRLFNAIFWGGLWGMLFSLIHPRIPGGLMLIKGLIFGLLILIFSNWIALPLIRGEKLFVGFEPMRMLAGACIVGGFGLGLGFLYPLFRRT